MHKARLIAVVVLCAVLAAIVVAARATRAWVRSLGMEMAELLADDSFRGLCERKDEAPASSSEPAYFLSLCARLHCACVHRALMSIPAGAQLVGYVHDAAKRRRAGVVLRRADGSAVLVFRCAVRVGELLPCADARCEQGARGGRCHRGLLAAYRALAPQVRRLLRGHEDVTVAGYSLGGALAIMAALELTWTKTVDAFVFAAPACVDRACADALARLCRVATFVNTADPITRPRGRFVHANPTYFHAPERNAHAYGAYVRGLFSN